MTWYSITIGNLVSDDNMQYNELTFVCAQNWGESQFWWNVYPLIKIRYLFTNYHTHKGIMCMIMCDLIRKSPVNDRRPPRKRMSKTREKADGLSSNACLTAFSQSLCFLQCSVWWQYAYVFIRYIIKNPMHTCCLARKRFFHAHL